ncbi:MAG: phosphoribosylformylglycinamidine synthase subunit PurS [Saprospiraceae bacterium]
MKFYAEIDIMPHKELLDPQGKTVGKNLKNIGLTDLQDVRIGKHIQLMVEGNDEADARAKVEIACDKLLANLIMETYSIEVFAL